MRTIMLVTIAGILALSLAGCTGGGGGGGTVAATKPGVGSNAPEIAAGAWYNTQNNQAITLASQREAGKFVVLSFCRSDCGVCKAQMPALVGLYNQWKDKATFITLSDEETGPIEQCLQDFAAVQWPVGAKSETYRTYELEYVPTYVLIDRTGVILYLGNNAVDGATDVDDLKTAMEKNVQ